MLISVQYARAGAALLVVLAHLSGFAAFQPVSSAHFGGFGVDIFFVISGFIMWQTSRDQRPGDFMRRRISRIVPPYWFYTSLLVLLALFAPRLAPNVELSWTAVFGSYLFIPYADHRGVMNPILLQGWTLNFEMYFYIVFALSLFLAKPLLRFLSVAGLFLLSTAFGISSDKSLAILSQVTNTILFEFVIGMMVSIAWQRWKITAPASLAMALASVIGLIYAELSQPSVEMRFFVFGIPAAFLLFGLLGTEAWLARRPSRVLLAAGDASYSLYLGHPFVLSAVHMVFNGPVRNRLGLDGVPLGVAYGVTAIAAALVLSYLSFAVLEKPSGRFLMARLFRNRDVHAPVKRAAS